MTLYISFRKMLPLFLPLSFAIIAVWLVWNFHWKRAGLPPGPTPLPFIGNLWTIAQNPPGYEPFLRWRCEFGPIYTVWFGEHPLIVLASAKVMRQTLLGVKSEAFAGRYHSQALFRCFSATKGHLRGITRTDGEQWSQLRRFFLRAMREFGMGREQMDQLILRRLNNLIAAVEERFANKTVIADRGERCLSVVLDIEPLLDQMSGAIVSELLFGHGFDTEKYTQLEFRSLKRAMHRVQAVQGSTRGQLLVSMPWLRLLPGSPFSRTFYALDNAVSDLYAFFDQQIQEKRIQMQGKFEEKESVKNGNWLGAAQVRSNGENSEEHQQSLCFVDMFLEEIEKHANSNDNTTENRFYNLEELRGLCFDIFFAGQETSSNTMCFLVLYMLLDQRSQRRMQAELDALERPLDEPITSGDRPRLPFTQAVINETQRLCNLLPINLSHRTMEAVEVGGFQIPAGTPILPQISCAMYDSEVFPEPFKFRPERFLEEKQRLKKYDELLPFGLGKRQCAGEPLARAELFLFTVNFFRRFEVAPEDPLHPPPTTKRTLLTVTPEPYRCRLTKRH